jgi:hypothetical protein
MVSHHERFFLCYNFFMVFAVSLSLVNLILYCAQQLGVTLGVGAETVLLVAYLQSMRDGIVDEEEKHFSRAVRRVMDVGLFLIIVSGLGVVASSYLSGQQALFSTAFLFKWSLIGIVLFMSLANRGNSLASGLLQGIAAGTWYALFVVHILAPDASWLELGVFYAIWLVGFCLCWTLIVFALKGKPGVGQAAMSISKTIPKPSVVIIPNRVVVPPMQKAAPPVPPSPKPAPVVIPAPVPPPPPARPAVPVPVPPPAPVPTVVLPMPPAPVMKIQSPDVPIPPPPPTAPAPAAAPAASLIGLHVMPRTVEEVERRKASMR